MLQSDYFIIAGDYSGDQLFNSIKFCISINKIIYSCRSFMKILSQFTQHKKPFIINYENWSFHNFSMTNFTVFCELLISLFLLLFLQNVYGNWLIGLDNKRNKKNFRLYPPSILPKTLKIVKRNYIILPMVAAIYFSIISCKVHMRISTCQHSYQTVNTLNCLENFIKIKYEYKKFTTF